MRVTSLVADQWSVSDRRFLLAVSSVSHEKKNGISGIFHNFLGSGKGYGKDFFQAKKGYGKEKGFCQNPKKGKGKGKEILGIPERIMGFVMELWKKDP